MLKIANLLKNLKKDDKGFTLIELMVVIAVLGILSALVIPQFSNVSDKARLANASSQAQAVASAAAMVYAEDGTTGSDIDGKIPQYLSNYNEIKKTYTIEFDEPAPGKVTLTETDHPNIKAEASYR